MTHDHWCPGKGQFGHFIRDCRCPHELPVNKVCAQCIADLDRAKDEAVDKAYQDIIDKDPTIK